MFTKFPQVIWVARVAIALALAELLARLMVPDLSPAAYRLHSLPFVQSFFAGYYLAPGKSRVVEATLGDETRSYPINSLGFRGRDVPVEKPPGTIRVMMIGASGLFDLFIGGDDDWPSRVGRELQRRFRTPIEVLNVGDPDSFVIDRALRITTDLYRLHPDYVLLYGNFNELKYFHRRGSLYQAPPFTEKNLYIEYANAADRVLSDGSRFYSFLRHYFLQAFFYPYARGDLLGHQMAGEPGTAPLDGPTEAALAQYELSVKLFVDSVRNIKAVPVLMPEPTFLDGKTSPELFSMLKSHFNPSLTQAGALKSLLDMERILASVANEKKVALFSARERMAGRPELFTDHVHVNAQGREVLSALVADQLETLLRKGAAGVAPAR